MVKVFKKIFLIFGVILFIIAIGGCSNDKNDVFVINSYESLKIMPSTIFEIEMKSEYLQDENYEIIVKYGHLRSIDNSEKVTNNIALFQVHYYADENKTSLSYDELISGKRLFEIENFYSTENKALSEIVNGEKVITFNNEMTINIPKEVIISNSGLISLSLTTFYLDDSGQINSSSYDGSVIYLKYIEEEGKIYFQKK